MALAGRIEDFGIADVFQLIQQSLKSGLMTLRGADEEVTLAIKEGWIISASNPLRPVEARFGSRLVGVGALTSAQLGMVLKRRAETSGPVASIIHELGFAPPDVLEKYATLMAQDTVLEPFTWRSGSYDFQEANMGLVGSRWVRPIALEALLMNGIRLHDEWPLVQERLPDSGARVVVQRPYEARRPDPAQDLALDELGGLEGEEHNELQRVVYELCKPRPHLETVIERSPYGRYDTLLALSSLVADGFVAPLSGPRR